MSYILKRGRLLIKISFFFALCTYVDRLAYIRIMRYQLYFMYREIFIIPF